MVQQINGNCQQGTNISHIEKDLDLNRASVTNFTLQWIHKGNASKYHTKTQNQPLMMIHYQQLKYI
jgi:hypothetical protein